MRANSVAFLIVATSLSTLSCSGSDSGNVAAGGDIGVSGSSGFAGSNANGGVAIGGSIASTGGSLATGGAVSMGGTRASGGALATGGAIGAGGTKAAAGGVATTGGALAIGGSNAAGGALATGGAVATGGKATAGGAVATGGSPATGGAMTTTGGAKTTGGATATGGAKATGGSIATGGSPATGGGVSTSCGAGTSTSSDVVVNLNGVQQKISGFGASTAWGSTMSAADADLLWSTTSGAGLSLHRIRIAPDGTTTETNIAKLAVARGVTVWATPWSPAASYKSNGNVNGGTIVDGSRQAWANSMAKFVTTMAAAGVNIYAVSAQNEPDATVSTYESCTYTAAALATFIGTYLGPALANSGVKLMGPETQNWCGFKSYADAIMNNSAAASAVSIIATHEYG